MTILGMIFDSIWILVTFFASRNRAGKWLIHIIIV